MSPGVLSYVHANVLKHFYIRPFDLEVLQDAINPAQGGGGFHPHLGFLFVKISFCVVLTIPFVRIPKKLLSIRISQKTESFLVGEGGMGVFDPKLDPTFCPNFSLKD